MRIAAALDSFALSQNSFYLLKTFNKLSENLDNNVYGFYQNLSHKPLEAAFSIMHVYYASYYYNGLLIATDLSTLRTISKIDNNAKRYFYVWDLEWLRTPQPFLETVKLVKNVGLIARSDSHARVISNYFNKPVDAIISDWNIEGLKSLWTQK